MKVLYLPQVNDDDVILYEFSEDIVKVYYNKEYDEFDFAGMPDGIAETIETTLPIKVIFEAERINGVLYLKLLNFIPSESDESLKFPDWTEV